MKKINDYLEKTRIVSEKARERGLSPLETEVVLYMGLNKIDSEENASNMLQIYQDFFEGHASYSGFAAVLKTLRGKKYTDKKINPEDERQKLVWLEENGRNFYSELEEII